MIATPVIIGVISKTERQAFERSIDGLLETVRLDYSTDSFVSPREYYYEGKDLILLTVAEETKDENVGMKGKIEGKGFIYIDEEGAIHIENICSKKYCASGEENKIEITENESGVILEVGKNDPIIRLIGEKTIYVNLGEVYEEPGAVAKTKSGKLLEYTKEITISATGEIVSNIDISVENTYVITYKTTNEGKEVSVSRNVIVLDMKPEIRMSEGSPDYVQKQEVLISASAKVSPNKITSFTAEIKKDSEVIETKTVTEPSITITLSETGIYEVKVTVTDSNNRTSTVSRTYKIDSTPPEIIFTEEIELKADKVSEFDLLNDRTVIVTDNSNLVTWKLKGSLDSMEGEYKITYTATDQAGNETTKVRTIYVKQADGPLLSRSSESSNGIWTGPQTIKLFAIITNINDELTSFTYQVDDGEVINVRIEDKRTMSVEVPLNTTGKHTIKVSAVGKYNNKSESEEPLGEYWIDTTPPTVGSISGNTDTWTTDKTLQATLTDNDSKIKYYALTKDATKPAENSSEWQSVGETPTSPYSFSKPVTENGTYYLWAKDSAGNVSFKSVTVSKIDRTEPNLTTITKGKKAILTSSDLESGLAEKPYRCDNGTWQTSNICVFETTGIHTVTAKNGAGVLKTNTVNISIIGNPPVLANLTPIVYKDNNWYVADTSKIWYDYENQEWANAVLLKSGSKSAGQIVDIASEVKAMFVWIPRYEYLIDTQFGKHSDGTLGTSANPGLINVRFVSNVSGQTYKNSETTYGVHPAFQFGDKSLPGMWVGKYTTSGSIDEPTVLPNASVLVNQTVETMNHVSKKMSVTGFDSHMSKQSEWGAVLYLAKSIYGIGDMSGVIMNTTNNEYGIDDFGAIVTEATLSGWELDHTASHLSFLQDRKYYDSYTYTDGTFNHSCNGGICFGHALSEMNKWYLENDVSTAYNSECYWITHYPLFDAGLGINNPSAVCGFAYPGVVLGGAWNIQFRIVLS